MNKKILNLMPARIFSFYNEINSIKDNTLPLPRIVIYHPTYSCNHNCIGCDFFDDNKKHKNKCLTKNKATYLINQFIKLGVKSVEFSGGGEPLNYPYLENDINKLFKNGIKTGIISNGSLFIDRILKTIILKSSYLRISIEAGSQVIFNKVKGLKKSSQEFYKVIKNIEKAVSLRKKLKSNIDISLKVTLGKENYTDIENAMKLAIKLKVDSIQFKLYENNNVMLRNGNSTLLKTVQNQFKNLKNKYKKNINIIGDLKTTKLKKHCILTPIITTVDMFGDVYLCSYYRHRKESHKIGNLFDNDFLAIWKSKNHLNKIKQINKQECNLYNCRFHYYNDLINEISKNSFLEFI